MSEFILKEDAIEIAKRAAKDLPVTKEYTVDLMLDCCHLYNTVKGECFQLGEVKGFIRNFSRFVEEKDHKMLLRKRGPKTPEVDIIEFVESQEFMNMKGHVYPKVKDALWEMWHEPHKEYVEVVLTGCLAGHTEIRINRRNANSASRIYTLRDAFMRFNHIRDGKKGYTFWKDDVPTRILSLENGLIGYKDVEDIVYSGVQSVYEVVTETGKRIKATANHPFKTSEGYKKLRNLKKGDFVICKGDRPAAVGKQRPRQRRWVYSIPFHPFGGRQFVADRNYKRLHYARLVIEADMNGLSVSAFIKILRWDEKTAKTLNYLDPALVVHHKDFDPLNDSLNNLETLTNEEHSRIHGNSGLVANFKHAVPVAEKIVAIKSRGEEETFDIIMAGEPHNFVANDFVVHNSTGIGKSFMLEMNIAYMAYKLGNQWDAQAEFDLAPGSPLYIVLQAGSYDQAKNILFRPLHARMLRSPYFEKIYRFRRDVNTEMIFPNNVYIKPFSGSDDAVLGLTVVGAGITELNRMSYIKKSKKTKKGTEEQTYDQAVQVYETLFRRMIGRTMQLGRLWGKLILDAAHEHEDDFTSQRMKEAKTNSKIYVYKKAQWEVIPSERFCGKKFLIEKGTEKYRTRVLLDRSQAIDETRIIEIPIEYKTEFEKDPEGALRDFGGDSVAVQNAAIPYREQVVKAMEDFEKITDGRQLFFYDEILLQDFCSHTGRYGWHELVDLEYIQEILMGQDIILAGHMDPALNHCNMGIAIGHINAWKLAPPFRRFDHKTKAFKEDHEIQTPISMIDGILAVSAPLGDEIDLEAAQALVIYIYENTGLRIFSVDSYQSAQMRQAWSTVGLATGRVSVDDSLEPYTRLKLAYRDSRVITVNHPIYKTEVLELQFDGSHFIHLPGKSKDCSDAVAGCLYLIETHVVDYTPSDNRDRRQLTRGRRLGRRFARPIG